MSVIFYDGFDEYDTLTLQWNSSNANITIQTAAARNGRAGVSAASNHLLKKQCLARQEHATFYIGIAVYRNGSSASGNIHLWSDSMATQHDTLEITNVGTLNFRRGTSGGTILGSSSAGIITANTWKYIEIKCTLSDSAGVVEVRVDGSAVIGPLTSQDTKNAGTKTVFDSIGMDGSGMYYDDVYWLNGAGSANNSFLGDMRVTYCAADSEGNSIQFTPSTGSTHNTLVDETPQNTTDFNTSSADNQIDLYGCASLPSGAQGIAAVIPILYVAKSDAGSYFAKRELRSSGTNYEGASYALSTTFTYLTESGGMPVLETDPATSAAWTKSGVDALEVGVKASAT